MKEVYRRYSETMPETWGMDEHTIHLIIVGRKTQVERIRYPFGNYFSL